MRGELPAVEGVAAEEAEDARGPAVSARHALRLQLQEEPLGFDLHDLGQGRPPAEGSRVEAVRLSPHVHVEAVGCL